MIKSPLLILGLEFNERFPISLILADKGLTPGHTYSSEEIVTAMRAFLNDANPALECERMEGFVFPGYDVYTVYEIISQSYE